MLLMLVPEASNDPKSHVTPHFNNLDPRNEMVPLMMPSHHVMPIPVPKSHVASHFDLQDLRNLMVPLMKMSSSCDAGGSAGGVT